MIIPLAVIPLTLALVVLLVLGSRRSASSRRGGDGKPRTDPSGAGDTGGTGDGSSDAFTPGGGDFGGAGSSGSWDIGGDGGGGGGH